RLFGNTWYVGTDGLSSLLITSDSGHILIDGGLPSSAPLILANIRKAGFRPEDVKVLLNSHEHYDHAGGLAALQDVTGAELMVVTPAARPILTSRPREDDPQRDLALPFPVPGRLRTIGDGDVVRVGPLALTLHRTGGHTRGGSTWTWESCEGTRCLQLVYADSRSPISGDGFRFSDGREYPEAVGDFHRGERYLKSLRCDLLVTPHPSASALWERLARGREALVDRTACRRYAEASRRALDARLAREAAEAPPPPPNAPAAITRTDSTLALQYAGRTILSARITATGDRPDVRVLTDTTGGIVTQVVKWTARGRGGRIRLEGRIATSGESWAAEPDPAEDARPVVRHSEGNASSALDRGVYDRHGDWVVSVDFPARARARAAGVGDTVSSYTLDAEGGEVAVRFRPRFYQRHRGLARYAPWTYRPWAGSVAGWTSWYAFFDRVTEADVRRTADVMAQVLKPYGFTYLQIDDGYQQVPIGTPDRWLTTNAKFPAGLPALQQYIADRGLEPGIWTNVSFAHRDSALAHPEWFLRDASGAPVQGNWVGYVMDGANPATLARLILPVYDSLTAMGWSYFKLDALRHLRYEGYNSFSEWFEARRLDREEVFRSVVAQVRASIGPEHYLLACWGIRPELIGLVDGMRVGDDGFGYGAFAQYNSFNNVVWRNDPDHIELRQPDRYRATTLTSLTGSVMMVTDPPEVYATDRVEAAQRTAPIPFTRPGQLYDVDASRSSLLGQAGRTVSGAGPRPFDADQRLTVPLYALGLARAFEAWTVVARTGGDADLPLAELGLEPGTDYVGFEFWTRRALGVVRDTLHAGAVDPTYQVQAICLRRREAHPQLLATDRHVTCGGPDLEDLTWEDRALAGVSAVVPGAAYRLYLTEPAGWPAPEVAASGATVEASSLQDGVRVVTFRPSTGRGAASVARVRWRLRYPAPTSRPSPP
ncbi:MAG: subclass B3 metallo-beta-lactamase, partial [Gemmatimonadaceae bacterium]|nr:subclass B3 metallo-beta-lactamase [Gemmatimonadaceae bacterium]